MLKTKQHFQEGNVTLLLSLVMGNTITNIVLGEGNEDQMIVTIVSEIQS